MEIGKIIAYNLKRIREERNLSLGQLADNAGVSKVVLSQIEKGDSNPTINTIWKITGALGLPYTSLLDLPAEETKLVRKEEIHELVEDKYHIFSYYPKDRHRNFEMYQIEMEPGCIHNSIGHSTNSSEYIMIINGQALIDINGKEYVLSKDDALFFEASVPHCYKNKTDRPVKMVLLIYYN